MWKAFTILAGGMVAPGIEITSGEIKLGYDGMFPIPLGNIRVKKGKCGGERLVSVGYAGDIALICIRQQVVDRGDDLIQCPYKVESTPNGGGITLMGASHPPSWSKFPVECIYAVHEKTAFSLRHLQCDGYILDYRYENGELVLLQVNHIPNKE